MRRTMTALCVAVAASWVMVAAAQAQSTPPSGQSGSQPGSMTGSQSGSMHQHSAKANEVKLTGCLEQDPSGKGYRLTNVSESTGSSTSSEYPSSSGSTSSGTSSSGSSAQSGSSSQSGSMSGTSGTSGSENTVELVASKKVDLKAHVGHRIEVTGVPTGTARSSSKKGEGMSGTSGTGSTASSGTSGSWSGHKIRVESIKHISDSCSAQ